jgi:hypothetical protein
MTQAMPSADPSDFLLTGKRLPLPGRRQRALSVITGEGRGWGMGQAAWVRVPMAFAVKRGLEFFSDHDSAGMLTGRLVIAAGSAAGGGAGAGAGQIRPPPDTDLGHNEGPGGRAVLAQLG